MFMKTFFFLMLAAVLSMAVSAHQVQSVTLPKPNQDKERHSIDTKTGC